jgi:hypothetical protein
MHALISKRHGHGRAPHRSVRLVVASWERGRRVASAHAFPVAFFGRAVSDPIVLTRMRQRSLVASWIPGMEEPRTSHEPPGESPKPPVEDKPANTRAGEAPKYNGHAECQEGGEHVGDQVDADPLPFLGPDLYPLGVFVDRKVLKHDARWDAATSSWRS